MLEPEIKLRQLRDLKGFTQEHVANELGISIKAYSNIESGQTQLTFERFEQICEVLEVSPMKALGFDEKTIFDRCQIENNTNVGTNHTYHSPKERELYEQRIKHLEGEVAYLRGQLEKVLKG